MSLDFPDPPPTGPPQWDASEGAWRITRRADVIRILRSEPAPVAAAGGHVRRLAGRTTSYAALADLLTDMPILQNPPAHGACRAWLKPIMQDVAQRWSAAALDIKAREVLDDIGPSGTLDAASWLARALPECVTAEVLGMDPEALEEAAEAQHQIMDGWWWATPLRDYPGLEAKAASVRRLCDSHPLMGGSETPPAAWATLAFLLIGAVTTAALIGNAIHVLAQRADLQVRLREAPGDVDAFVEECLRFCGAVKRVAPRSAATALAIDGVEIAPGEMMVIRLDSSSRDPEAHDRPDVFDMDRSGPQPLAFSIGPHLCPGAFLGRLEARAMVRGLVERFRILPGTEPSRIAESRHFLMFDALPIRLEPA